MWRSKKFIVIAVLVAVMLAGSIGGVLLAADNGDDSQPEARYGALWDRVSEVYEQKTGVALDQEALKAAFAQAQSDMRAEVLQKLREMETEALRNRLQNLVDQGKITQGEADQYLEWQQSRPDVSVGFGFRGMGGPRGWGGRCIPTE